jgi:1,4-alpha-glucan branching enzyme
MKIKSKAAVKTVAAKKSDVAAKGAATATKKAPAKSSAERRVTFTVRAEAGKVVYLAGCFNQWNPTGKKMTDKKTDGVYSTTVKLAPGTYEYKFVIDGVWCADPENTDFVKNDCGTLNSVITVK